MKTLKKLLMVSIIALALPCYVSAGDELLDENTDVDLETYSGGNLYFAVRDLKGAAGGYYTTINIGHLTVSGTSKLIDKKNVYIQTDNQTNSGTPGVIMSTESGVTKLDGLVTPPQAIPDEIYCTKHTYSSIGVVSQEVLSRDEDTTPDTGILGEYGIQPVFYVEIPKYQEIGKYDAIMDYTLIEQGVNP